MTERNGRGDCLFQGQVWGNDPPRNPNTGLRSLTLCLKDNGIAGQCPNLGSLLYQPDPKMLGPGFNKCGRRQMQTDTDTRTDRDIERNSKGSEHTLGLGTS